MLLVSLRINVCAQEQNPFELTNSAGQKKKVTGIADNPFEKSTLEENVVVEKPNDKPYFLTEQSTQFFLLVGLLLSLAVVLTFLRSFAFQSFRALGTDNWFNALFREMVGRGIFPYLLLYIFFFLHFGVLIYFSYPLISKSLGFSYSPPYYWLLLSPFLLLGIKHLLLTSLSFIFPIRKEMDRYQFLMVVTGISIGILISPINIFLPYLNDDWQQLIIYLALILAGLIVLYHYIRSLTIGIRFIVSHQFHFLLYICTVEIAPVLILVKLIINSL
jgi:hypothetical protein